MKLVLDTHTHTIVSGHAYSTMQEMILAAKEKNLELLALTEHGPALPGTCNDMYYRNFRVIPRQYGSLSLLMGMEANIMDYKGKLDAKDGILKRLDYLVASLHLFTITPGSPKENTKALVGAMEHPLVCTIGHPDDGRYPVLMEEVVRAAKETGTLLELNNSSLMPGAKRENARENDKEMLKFCAKHGVSIVLDSDAHISYDVGNFTAAVPLLEEVDFPEELVVNTSVEKFRTFLKKKRKG